MAVRADPRVEAGRRYGEDVVEAAMWSAVEERLLALDPGDIAAFLVGIEAWGAELLDRWAAEVGGFQEAFEEDDRAGRLEPLRELPEPPGPAGIRLVRSPPPRALAPTSARPA